MVLVIYKLQSVHNSRNIHRQFTELVQDIASRNERVNEQNFVLLEDVYFSHYQNSEIRTP
jgi:hypothetical protein